AMPPSDFGITRRTQRRRLAKTGGPVVTKRCVFLTAAFGAAEKCHGTAPKTDRRLNSTTSSVKSGPLYKDIHIIFTRLIIAVGGRLPRQGLVLLASASASLARSLAAFQIVLPKGRGPSARWSSQRCVSRRLVLPLPRAWAPATPTSDLARRSY